MRSEIVVRNRSRFIKQREICYHTVSEIWAQCFYRETIILFDDTSAQFPMLLRQFQFSGMSSKEIETRNHLPIQRKSLDADHWHSLSFLSVIRFLGWSRIDAEFTRSTISSKHRYSKVVGAVNWNRNRKQGYRNWQDPLSQEVVLKQIQIWSRLRDRCLLCSSVHSFLRSFQQKWSERYNDPVVQ